MRAMHGPTAWSRSRLQPGLMGWESAYPHWKTWHCCPMVCFRGFPSYCCCCIYIFLLLLLLQVKSCTHDRVPSCDTRPLPATCEASVTAIAANQSLQSVAAQTRLDLQQLLCWCVMQSQRLDHICIQVYINMMIYHSLSLSTYIYICPNLYAQTCMPKPVCPKP